MTIQWDDPKIGIDWPLKEPILSQKDTQGLRLNEVPTEKLF